MEFCDDFEKYLYVNFLGKYYPATDLKLCIARADEGDWKALGRIVIAGKKAIEEIINNRDNRASDKLPTTVLICPLKLDGGDIATFSGAVGYFIPTINLVAILKLSEDLDARMQLMRALEGSKYFIAIRSKYNRSFEEFLVTLFHEPMHVIEVEYGIRVFRGYTIEQEARADREIVMPLVRQFLGKARI
jgi:hypothetical protein